MAWTGDLKNAGGVCEKNGHYRGSLKVTRSLVEEVCVDEYVRARERGREGGQRMKERVREKELRVEVGLALLSFGLTSETCQMHFCIKMGLID